VKPDPNLSDRRGRVATKKYQWGIAGTVFCARLGCLRLTFTVATLFCTPAYADWYAKSGIALGNDRVSNISHHDTIGIPGTYLGDALDGALKDEQIYDYTPSLIAALGFQYGNWSFETDFSDRYRTDWDIRSATHNLRTVTNVFSNIESKSLLLNVARQSSTRAGWRWAAGIGAGASHTSIDTEYIERANPAIGLTEWSVDTSRSDSNFAWSASVGLSKSLGDRWSLNIDYRFIDFDEVRIGPVQGRPARLSGDFTSHELHISASRWSRTNSDRR